MSHALSVPYMTEPKGELEPHLFLDVSFAHRFIPAVHHTCETLIPRFVLKLPAKLLEYVTWKPAITKYVSVVWKL